MLYWSWKYVMRAGLLKDDATYEVSQSICQRVVIVQSLYAVGAAFCLINTWVSIAAIVLVQLNYALAPGRGRASK
jgi:uncharacterized membrane protein